MTDTAPIIFTIEELWLLQSVIRHEMPQQESWKFPTASLALNDTIAEAILMCLEDGIAEACVLVSRGDCLAMDATVPQQAKNAAGVAIGKNILVKTFQARRTIAGGPVAGSTDETVLSPDELEAKLSEWKARRSHKRR